MGVEHVPVAATYTQVGEQEGAEGQDTTVFGVHVVGEVALT